MRVCVCVYICASCYHSVILYMYICILPIIKKKDKYKWPLNQEGVWVVGFFVSFL